MTCANSLELELMGRSRPLRDQQRVRFICGKGGGQSLSYFAPAFDVNLNDKTLNLIYQFLKESILEFYLGVTVSETNC